MKHCIFFLNATICGRVHTYLIFLDLITEINHKNSLCYLIYLVLSKMSDLCFSPCTCPALSCTISPLIQNILASPVFWRHNHPNFMSTLRSQHNSSHCPELSLHGPLNCDSVCIQYHPSHQCHSERPFLITSPHSRQSLSVTCLLPL